MTGPMLTSRSMKLPQVESCPEKSSTVLTPTKKTLTKNSVSTDSASSQESLATPPASSPVDTTSSCSREARNKDDEDDEDDEILEVTLSDIESEKTKAHNNKLEAFEDENIERRNQHIANEQDEELAGDKLSATQQTPDDGGDDHDDEAPNKLTKKEKVKLENRLKRETESKVREEKKKKEQEEKEQRKREREAKAELKKRQKEERDAEKKREKEARDAERKRKLGEKEAEKKRKSEERELEKKRKLEEKEAEKEAKRVKIAEKESKKKGNTPGQTKLSSFFMVKKKLPRDESTNDAGVISQVDGNDYQNFFFNFFVKENASLACSGHLEKDELLKSKDVFDSYFSGNESASDSVSDWLKNDSCCRGFEPKTTAEQVVDAINGSMSEGQIIGMLVLIPLKYLKFYETIKPAYLGTWSKINKTLASDPFFKFDNIDYDYDSDFELGEEEEDGEEVDSDGEEEDEVGNEEDEEFAGFVDDDSAQTQKRVQFKGQLSPSVVINNGYEFPEMQASILLKEVNLGIDPFKNYWGKSPTSVVEVPTNSRVPVKSVTISTSSATKINTLTVKRKPIVDNPDDIRGIVKFILSNKEMKNWTVPTMVDMVHQQFTKYSKAKIKGTIQKVSSKKLNSGWVINEEFMKLV